MALLNIIKNSFNGGILSDKIQFRTDLSIYDKGLSDGENIVFDVYGGVYKRNGFKYIGKTKYDDTRDVRLIGFEYSSQISFVLELGDEYCRFYRDGVLVEDGGMPYELVTPWSADELVDLKYASPDINKMYFVHNNHYPVVLNYLGNNQFSLESVRIDGPYDLEVDSYINSSIPTLYWSSNGDDIYINASSDIFIQADVGRTIQIYTGTSNLSDKSTDGYYHSFYLLEYVSSTQMKIEWLRLPINQDDNWQEGVIKSVWFFSVFGFIEDRPYDCNDLVKAIGFPKAIGFYEGRLLYASTEDAPLTFWASNSYPLAYSTLTNNYSMFYKFVSGIQNPDDYSYSYSIASDVISPIFWLLNVGWLLIGCEEDEWSLGSVDQRYPTTPNSVVLTRQSNIGSASIGGVLLGSSIFFIKNEGGKLININFDSSTASIISKDVTIYNPELLSDGVKEIIAVSDSSDNLYLVGNDDNLYSLNFSLSESVAAWTVFKTQGKFISVASIKGEGYDRDIYGVVRRENENGIYNSIEVYKRQPSTDVYLDSYAQHTSIDGVVSNLERFEGQYVDCIAEGIFYLDKRVEDGQITIGEDYADIKVGFKYTGQGSTMNLVDSARMSLNQSSLNFTTLRKLIKVSIYLENTSYLEIGSVDGPLEGISFRDTLDVLNEPVKPFTGLKEVVLQDTLNINSKVRFFSDKPVGFYFKSLEGVVNFAVQ